MSDRKQRSIRLTKVRDAQRDLESALLTLKQTYKAGWTDSCFESLYYLIKLARKAP